MKSESLKASFSFTEYIYDGATNAHSQQYIMEKVQ